MSSTLEHGAPSARPLRLLLAALTVVGCGLERPSDPPPFDCEQIDRADERFPEECGEPVDEAADSGAGDPSDANGEEAP